MLISSAYAQATGAQGGPESQLFQMWPFLLMFVALYFLMVRPQMKRQKEHKTMIESLQKGDEVVVAGGIVGKIIKLQEGYMSVEIAPQVEILVQRGAVTAALPKGTIRSI